MYNIRLRQVYLTDELIFSIKSWNNPKRIRGFS